MPWALPIELSKGVIADLHTHTRTRADPPTPIHPLTHSRRPTNPATQPHTHSPLTRHAPHSPRQQPPTHSIHSVPAHGAHSAHPSFPSPKPPYRPTSASSHLTHATPTKPNPRDRAAPRHAPHHHTLFELAPIPPIIAFRAHRIFHPIQPTPLQPTARSLTSRANSRAG